MNRTNHAVDFVIKISKYCNLRCSYCYEFNELGERRRMGLDAIRRFFGHARDAVLKEGRSRIHFIWHGGEPLLIPLDYYESIAALQREILDGVVDYANLLQTNLTVLTDRHIEFFQQKRFFNHAIGVSFDVYGDQRVDTRGRLRTQSVLANMQRLRDAGVRFGAITVLARNTIGRIAEIHRFYDSLGIPMRILPFYKSALDSQIAQHSLTFAEITAAMKQVFDAWLASERATAIAPLEDYTRFALSVLGDATRKEHDPDHDEHVFLVDTNGDTYGVADTYDASQRYGNLFEDDFGSVLRSATRAHAVNAARQRAQRYCAPCPYIGHCPGAFAAEATSEQRRMLEEEGCPVREIVTHIINRIRDTSVIERLQAQRAAHIASRPEIAVGA